VSAANGMTAGKVMTSWLMLICGYYTNEARWPVGHANIHVPKLKCHARAEPEC